MIATVKSTGFGLLLALAVGTSAWGLGGPDFQYADPQISDMTCPLPSNVGHRFSGDRSAAYVFEGDCTVTVDSRPKYVHYHVDGFWNPGSRKALETVRISGLRQVWSEVADPAFATLGYLCDADPWLTDARCGLEIRPAADQALVARFPRLTSGPWPLSRGAISGDRRADLKYAYDHGGAPAPAPAPGKPTTGVKVAHKPPIRAYGATYASGLVGRMGPGETNAISVTVTNTGHLTWDPNTFHLSYHWVKGGTQAVFEGGLRTPLPKAVGPRESVAVEARLKAPLEAGVYTLRWDMVQEPSTWFLQQGVPTGDQQVTVASSRSPVPHSPVPRTTP